RERGLLGQERRQPGETADSARVPGEQREIRAQPLVDLPRALVAARRRHLVPEPRGGNEQQPVARLARPQRPVGVLGVDEVAFVEVSDLPPDLAPREQTAPREIAGRLDRAVLALVAFAEPPMRAEAERRNAGRARIPDAIRRRAEIDERRGSAGARILLEREQQ